MVKRQRTPHFITGLGDGHVGRENSNNNQQSQQLRASGLRHPTNKIHTNTGVAGTDDIFQVTKHVRRNNNNNKDNNSNNNPNHYHVRPATTNERMVRMQLMDDAGKGGSRWDMIFSSSTSGDGSGSAKENGVGVVGDFGVVVNPMGTAEQWQMSAFAIVGMIVFLSALFLLVSDSASGSGGSSSHSHHHHHHHASNKYPRRSHIARTKRKTSGTTRKKKFDEWSSDEVEDMTDADMSDGQASTSTPINGVIVGGSHQTVVGSSSSSKPVLFYPYQPRHRKPSVNGQKETYAGSTATSSSYSPPGAAGAAVGAGAGTVAGGGFHSRNYYLNPSNPRDGPVMMSSYQTPTSSSLKVRLSSPQQPQPYHQNASSPAAATTAAGQTQSAQHPTTLLQPKLSEQQQQQQQQQQATPKSKNNAAAGVSSPLAGRSPAQPQRSSLATTLEQQFVATGLESFQANPPPAPGSGMDPADPQGAPLPHGHNINNAKAATASTTTMDIDEESQAQPISEASSTSPMSSFSQNHHPPSPAAGGGGANNNISPAVFNRQISYTNADNNYQAYSSTSWDHISSFNNDSNSDMLNESTHHASNSHNSSNNNNRGSGGRSNVHPHRNSGTSSIGMMSPRRDIDITDLETPRAGLTRRTVDVTMVNHQGGGHGGGGGTPQAHGGGAGGINPMAKRQQQQPLMGGFGNVNNNNNNPNDPFYTLRLPSTQAMGMMPQPPPPNEQNGNNALQGVGGNIMPDAGIPLLPKLDPTGLGSAAPSATGAGGGGGGQSNSSIAAPQSIQIDALRLEQMEFGSAPHWQVRNPSPSNAAASKPEIQIPPHNHHPFGSSSELFATQSVSSNTSDFEEDSAVETNEARKSIKHKRPNITDDTDAARSLQSSIKFKELKLEEVIGGGGFGQVWRAFWRGTPVAVKVLTGSAQARHVSKAILEEFAAEINLLSGMRHPNICLYMGACVDPPNRAIITELAANGSLWDALRLPLNPPFSASDGFSRHTWPGHLYHPGKHGTPPTSTGVTMPPVAPVGSWPWLLVKHVACGAARGMAYLHSGEPPILHRDLKSANILLNESYTAKVCDFGLSRLKAQERSMTGNCGTVQWMAPEVLANQRYNEKADVFSYGIICTELLTRECPYEGMSAIQCALAVLNRDQRPEIPRYCPPQLRALIKACVKKNPDERPTFGQIIMALDAMP